MVKYFLTVKDHKWIGNVIDDSEGTVGQSRQITRFRSEVQNKLEELVTKWDSFIFNSSGKEGSKRAEKFRREVNSLLEKYNFEIGSLVLQINKKTFDAEGLLFNFESTEK